MEGPADKRADGQAGRADGPKPTLTLICADPKPNPCGTPTPQLLQYANVGGGLENIPKHPIDLHEFLNI